MKIVFALAILVFLAALSVPVVAFAQKGGLVPCGETIAGGTLGGISCTWCHLLELIRDIINFMAPILIAVATAMIVYGGIMYLISFGRPQAISKAKGIITTAIIGLVIGLLAYVIIGTVVNVLAFGTTKPGDITQRGFPWPWNEINCQVVSGERPTGGEPRTASPNICAFVAGDGKWDCADDSNAAADLGQCNTVSKCQTSASQGRPCTVITSELCGQCSGQCGNNQNCDSCEANITACIQTDKCASPPPTGDKICGFIDSDGYYRCIAGSEGEAGAGQCSQNSACKDLGVTCKTIDTSLCDQKVPAPNILCGYVETSGPLSGYWQCIRDSQNLAAAGQCSSAVNSQGTPCSSYTTCQAISLDQCGTLSADLCLRPDVLVTKYYPLSPARYPYGNHPDLDSLIFCIKSSPLLSGKTFGSIFTYEQDNPLCNYTRGNPLCGPCVHKVDSCHYGGHTGVKGAAAVDFGLSGSNINPDDLIRAATRCWAGAAYHEPNPPHVHVSIMECDRDDKNLGN